jgi:hypothetical protein
MHPLKCSPVRCILVLDLTVCIEAEHFLTATYCLNYINMCSDTRELFVLIQINIGLKRNECGQHKTHQRAT